MNILQSMRKRNEQQQKGYQEGFAAGVAIAIKVNLFAIIQFLGDKRGWKRESIFDCLLWLHKHAEMILEDYLTFDSVREQVEDEYGIVEDNGIFSLLPEKEWQEAVKRKQDLELQLWRENKQIKTRIAKNREAQKNGN